MRHYKTSDISYTMTCECFSKCSLDFQFKKENFTKNIINRETIVNQCHNNIQLLGWNNMFDVNQLTLKQNEENKSDQHQLKSKNELNRKSTLIVTTPFIHNKKQTHSYQSSYYNTKQSIYSSNSNKKPLHKPQTSHLQIKQEFHQVFLTEATSLKTHNYRNKRTQLIYQTISDTQTQSTQRKISHRLPQLSYSDIKQSFPHKKFKSICDDFNTCTIQTNPLTERLQKDNNEENTFDIGMMKKKKKENNFEIANNESFVNKTRNIAPVYSKASKMFSMINKANADLMNFGDNYMKINDELFYRRQKEIMNSYQNIQHNANIEIDISEKKKDKLKKLRTNQFKIAKAFKSMTIQHTQFLTTLKGFKEKNKVEASSK